MCRIPTKKPLSVGLTKGILPAERKCVGLSVMEIIKNRIVTVNFEMTLSTLCGIRVPVNVGGFTQLQAT